jgi:uncharacterized protein DUF3987
LPVTVGRARGGEEEAGRVLDPQVSITGIVTHEMLRLMYDSKRNDGFWDYWLFVYPDRWPAPRSSEREDVSGEAFEGWARIVRRLWESPHWDKASLDGGGTGRRPVMHAGGDGKAAFEAGRDRHLDELNSVGFPEYLRGAWVALEIYAARLWLILSMLHHAADFEADCAAMPVASRESAEGAWRLVGFFKSHMRRVQACLRNGYSGGPPHGARLALNWINNHPESPTLSFRDITRNHSAANGYDREMLLHGVRWLEQRDVLRAATDGGDDQESNSGGRPRGPVWMINPNYARGG